MNALFGREGWVALRGAWVLLALAIVAAASIVLGSLWYLDRARRESVNVVRRVDEASKRLDTARRERDSLQESADVFRSLVERGVLQSERRLELVELVNALRTRYQLFSLDYEILPQRALALPGGRVFASVDVLASRVKFHMAALHEGDVLGFVQALSQGPDGFYAVDRCSMRRMEVADPDALVPHLEAECTLEWITLKEKNANRAG